MSAEYHDNTWILCLLTLEHAIASRIKLADEPLVLYLANGLDDTQVSIQVSTSSVPSLSDRPRQVTLQAADGGDDNQFWYLHPATN